MKELYCVIGNPIAHSLSPVMHTALLEQNKIDASFVPFLIKEGTFTTVMEGLKALGISGFNITSPFKEDILPFLDELDPEAESCGAVNTVVSQNGRWKGFNTDGIGYLEGLQDIRAITEADRILIVGAGGASKAIFQALTHHTDARLTVANRTLEKAVQMVEGTAHKAISLADAESQIANYTIVIQTTSSGLTKENANLPIRLHDLTAGTIVSDIIYNPAQTPFLKEAKAYGAVTQNGLPMFVNQAAIAFELWTGKKADRDLMREIVLKQLGGK
ncbi:shikimate 5-dehydrogenase [Listeria weihenstephanensis FSL R9-0317]|uniref:Shikimate dehydrogenase (NADP(+)) n=1 Tax=Listeria weihenstephanensis TaxID=1006155 RepID=A0A1S7FV15_9LIST|nr:shikimate dehydrogenase [Listeria weihenstephanensis]AQY51210.1 shikimate dehydrogenase [Listeria weihenstephanensis]EUJ36858.1 shikimate 5-dehydrogenase [Listeria weihenstephanensis FSL R9-0317]